MRRQLPLEHLRGRDGCPLRKAALQLHSDRASSSERTCAFLAALLARVQSPEWAASRASVTKLRTFEARSDCVGFSDLPCEAAMLRSAMLKLTLVCCSAAAASCAVNCGAIWGASGRAGLFGPGGATATRGRCGIL